MQYSKAVEPINCFDSHSIYTIVLPLQCCTISCYCCCLTVQYSKAVEHIPFMVSHVFTSVYCLCMYIASLFVISIEGMVLFLWLSRVVIREYTECLFTHRHLSDVCSVSTYMPYSAHTTECLQCYRLYTLHNVCFRTVHLCLSVGNTWQYKL